MRPDKTCSSTRRRLLTGALLGLGIAAPIARYLGSDASTRQRWFHGLVHDSRGAAAVGERYLRMRPEEGHASRLAGELFGANSLDEIKRQAPGSLRERIRAGRTADFLNGDLVILEG